MPFIFIGSSAKRFPEVSSVGSDIKQGVRLGMSTLIEKGHALPSLILGPKSRLARIRFLHAVREHCIEQVEQIAGPASFQRIHLPCELIERGSVANLTQAHERK